MKKTISATIDEDLLNWVDEEVSKNRQYRNKSHLIEIAIGKLKGE